MSDNLAGSSRINKTASPVDSRWDKPLLLERLQAGDNNAFQQLVSDYHQTLVTVARAIVGDSVAEEVVQDAWIAIHRSLPAFERRSSLKTWMYTIVSNGAKTRLRKESRTIAVGGESDAISYLAASRFHENGHWQEPPAIWDTSSPDALLEESQLQHCIDFTLTQLSDQQKAVFSLRDVEQYTLEEICNILSLTHSNVRVLLHRARLQLMQVIDRYQETGEC